MNYFASYATGGRTVFDPRGITQSAPAAPPVPDLNRFIAEGLLKPLLDGINTAAKNFSDTLQGTMAPSPTLSSAAQTQPSIGYQKHHHHDCGCHHEDCGCHHDDCGCRRDPCHCKCCIVNADLIVYARLGEIRVIPLVVENTWRRERSIKTELSGWTLRGGKPAPVEGKLLPPAPEFTLKPCGHQALTLVVRVGTLDQERQETDVDDGTVAYADLIVQGCDIRPLRLALAILPRDCEAYEIECGCECCC